MVCNILICTGPSGPFTLSVGFLILGALFAIFKWDENVAVVEKPTINDTIENVIIYYLFILLIYDQ